MSSGEVKWGAFGFGREHGGFQVGDFHKPESFGKVAKVCNFLGVKTVYCTQADEFSATICRPEDFPLEFVTQGVTIKTGVKASGCSVPKGAAAFRSTADCPTMIVSSLAKEVVVAHAGRDELIDRHRVNYGQRKPGRSHESVVDAIVDYYGRDISYLRIWNGFGIQGKFPHSRTDPRYAEFNQKLRIYIKTRWGAMFDNVFESDDLLLHRVIRLQWHSRYGVSMRQISEGRIDTREDVGSDNNPVWYSRSRDPRDNKTNGIFVVVN